MEAPFDSRRRPNLSADCSGGMLTQPKRKRPPVARRPFKLTCRKSVTEKSGDRVSELAVAFAAAAVRADHDNLGAHTGALIQVFDILVQHADTSGRHVEAD